MKRRSFLALLGLAPAAMALPSVALAVPEAECPPSAVNDAVRALMADWRQSANYDVWLHADGRFVTGATLVKTGIATPEEYCQRHNVKVLRKAGDYTVLSNGSAMHSDFPDRVTWFGRA